MMKWDKLKPEEVTDWDSLEIDLGGEKNEEGQGSGRETVQRNVGYVGHGVLDSTNDVVIAGSDLIGDNLLDGTHNEQGEGDKEVEVRCEFVTGGAGTGKTYLIRKRIEENPKWGRLAATTGIAAVNLGEGVTTINSLLGFFDTASLEKRYASGTLAQNLMKIREQNLVIDEVSMMEAKQLDLIFQALHDVNQFEKMKARGGLGLVLTGDFMQLPPVEGKDMAGKKIPAKYAFEAQCWTNFEKNTTKLSKVWRQEDEKFVEAMNAARQGDGARTARLLVELGVKFRSEVDTEFDGTTIFAVNAEVDRLNQVRLLNLLHGGEKKIEVRSYRWGHQRTEWKQIPETQVLSTNCYVMILVNDKPQLDPLTMKRVMRFANGSCGYVQEYQQGEVLTGEDGKAKVDAEGREKRADGMFNIRLKDKMERKMVFEDEGDLVGEMKEVPMVVGIGMVKRRSMVRDHPQDVKKPEYMGKKEWAEWQEQEWEKEAQEQTKRNIGEGQPPEMAGVTAKRFGPDNKKDVLYLEYLRGLTAEGYRWGQIYFDYEEGEWCIGEIMYYPLRIAYGTTVHKSQGLSLDKVQIDLSAHFFGNPSMCYVALSRARTVEGMVIVGTPKLVEARCNVSRKVLRWI